MLAGSQKALTFTNNRSVIKAS
ncbi:hypothetical protein CXB51_019943 [Gossypium anomalum]|uniref:Uncharacterized protein n=1 Tax=Gossypium anomalum TaxID=47600 RepID=A0A8J5YWX2_9ROSI|nr:hypothetical protein CXB51_019943 [Gossypium anomalum]